MGANSSTVAIAFGLNIAAGLSTCIGGMVILNRKLVHLANPSSLSIALGVAAGVMIFIALVEIFNESVSDFKKGYSRKNETACDSDPKCLGTSKLLASICFIIGAAIIFLIDWFVHLLSPSADHQMNVDELNVLRHTLSQVDLQDEPNALQIQNSHVTRGSINHLHVEQRLNRTGLLTALAIGIHNMPEGVATYTATLKSPQLGVTLAIAIALHNIPEGVAVAAPLYFATKSKSKALLWTLFSALFEPLGGVIALLIHAFFHNEEGLNPYVNGVMFGLVVGMMVTISIKELIPNAYRFARSGAKVTYAILFGMCFMTASLILIDYAGFDI